ncbi:hypothetical protein FE782_21245 [Paenibacillus antri]|uniref:DUF2512 family protein n=1 Tax=Paenibacillus antri TaxID=2582848 RepID=A0A5R9G1I0_9BACL|nr:hypothetical protein [Paenibacillus antri]TLS50197.1 hypothetical protein FE782_21245 [Paenibacillus antri]
MFMLLIKFLLVPALVGLADVMMADLFFPTAWSIVLIGLALAAVGLFMESAMLRRGTLWLTTAADWAVAAAGIYLAQYLFEGAYVSAVAALLAGGLIAIPEYFAHRSAIERMSRRRRY